MFRAQTAALLGRRRPTGLMDPKQWCALWNQWTGAGCYDSAIRVDRAGDVERVTKGALQILVRGRRISVAKPQARQAQGASFLRQIIAD